MYRYLLLLVLLVWVLPQSVHAQSSTAVATTTLTLSICGNEIVDPGEQCDVLGETGVYSTTIVGRQCTAQCLYGPYCGDGILQTLFTEECDDGNNDDGDFCSSQCRIEPAGSGGGGSSGGGGGGRGGSTRELGDTVISIMGRGYPSRTVNFLLDTASVGTVRTNASGQFEFSIGASPGTATLGVWMTDSSGARSITLNNTFDVTQGAITNINGVIVPPTLRVATQNINPGAVINLMGQAVPGATIEVHFDDSNPIVTTTSSDTGEWALDFNTSRLSVAEHSVRARSITGTPPLTTQSGFSSTLQLFVGVDGQSTTPSDLSRDGRVNLVDFSILIFWWQTAGGESDPPADINGNGRVGLEDFSIMLFNWTG